VRQSAEVEVRNAIQVLDKALVASTYLVGDHLSVADIAVLCATCHLVQSQAQFVEEFPAFGRWLLTLLHQPHVIAVLKDKGTSIIKGFSSLSGPSRLAAQDSARTPGSLVRCPWFL
jgi:glutathione S-transferase